VTPSQQLRANDYLAIFIVDDKDMFLPGEVNVGSDTIHAWLAGEAERICITISRCSIPNRPIAEASEGSRTICEVVGVHVVLAATHSISDQHAESLRQMNGNMSLRKQP